MRKIFTTFLVFSLLNLNYSCQDEENVLLTDSSNAIVNFEKTIVSSSNNAGNSSRKSDSNYISDNDTYIISNIVLIMRIITI